MIGPRALELSRTFTVHPNPQLAMARSEQQYPPRVVFPEPRPNRIEHGVQSTEYSVTTPYFLTQLAFVPFDLVHDIQHLLLEREV